MHRSSSCELELRFDAHEADYRHRRRAEDTARRKGSNFMVSSRLRYHEGW
jgi:hypothetical protein